MIQMTFLQHDGTQCWVWVSDEVADNPPEWLINNRIDVTGYEKGAMHFDVSFGAITGSDWESATALIRLLERAFYAVSENLDDETVETFYESIADALVDQLIRDGVGDQDHRLLALPIRTPVPAVAEPDNSPDRVDSSEIPINLT